MSGEFIAIGVAFLWTLSALFFEHAGKQLGSVNLNIIRLFCAFIFIGVTLMIMNGSFLPAHANKEVWIWMALSGLVGFVIGDYFLFASYAMISARYSQLIMTLASPFAALAGFAIIGEKLSWMALAGMCVTLTGISISILKKENGNNGESHNKLHMRLPVKGVLFALMGAIGQGVGIVLSKQGMLAYENCYPSESVLYIPLAATQIRTITGIISFVLIIVLTGGIKNFFTSIKNRKGVKTAVIGSIFGPFLGVTFSLMAVQYANTAVASTIMATVPVIILLPEYLFLKRKVTWVQVTGAVISVVGVTLFFI